ncbi:MAG: glycosyltransferase family 39 protein [Planctomycetes bacterium]|nr:glycosyltransferase family 39 protein [Planctomycetota bacterium]
MYRRLTVAGLLIFHILLVGWIALCKSPVVDEAPHLVAGIIHCKFGTFDLYRVNPPLVRSVAALPVLLAGIETDWMGGWADNPFARPEFLLGRRLLEVNPERCFWLVTLARWACLPFTLLGAIICYLWARDLYGTNAGLVALLLWCFDPNLMGWSATLCPDAPAASVGVFAAYVYWRWLRQPSWGGIWLAGLAFGMALLTKSTWLVLFGIWPAVWLIWYLIQRRPDEQAKPRSTSPSGIGVVMILLIGLYVVNAGYGFANCLRPLGNFSFISGALAGGQPFGQVGNRFRGKWFEIIPVPLPADFVIGVDVQR